MIEFCKGLKSRRAAAIVVAIGMVFAAGRFVVRAQSQQGPAAEFQYATLTGSGNTITASQVPVVISSGLTVYENVTMQFNVDSNGNLTLASGYPQIAPAPTLLTSGFIAGNYVGPSTVANGKALVTVSGPGVTDGGATEWSISAASGADPTTSPSSATWYVGPISNNPMAARLQSAGITSTAYSYGFATAWYGECNSCLIGVSQTGNTITIVTFTNNIDRSTPVAQITYTLRP